MNPVFLALSVANPGLLPLAFTSSPSYTSCRDSGHHGRKMRERRAREDAERKAQRERMFAHQPADIRGLDPEDDGWLIDRIERARTLETLVEIDAEFERKLRRNKNHDIDDLCPEEDGWLIDKIIRDRPLAKAQREQRRRDLKMRQWTERLMTSEEGRP